MIFRFIKRAYTRKLNGQKIIVDGQEIMVEPKPSGIPKSYSYRRGRK